MKRGAKHKKELKKTLSFYRLHYGINPPYNVLFDSEFLVDCAKADLDPRREVLGELNEKMTPMVTPEVLQDLRQRREWAAVDHAKTFFFLKAKPVTTVRENTVLVDTEKWVRPLTDAALSIKRRVGDTNTEHYVVAANDKDLRRELGNVPGVPLLHADVELKKVIMNPAGSMSKQNAQQKIAAKAVVGAAAVPEAVVEKAAAAELVPAKKKKKKGGANPLACKKKRKRPDIR